MDCLLQSASATIRECDPMQAITDQIAGRGQESMSPNRLRTFLLAAFASIALLLATIGIYGVISSSVAQRTHEIMRRARRVDRPTARHGPGARPER